MAQEERKHQGKGSSDSGDLWSSAACSALRRWSSASRCSRCSACSSASAADVCALPSCIICPPTPVTRPHLSACALLPCR
eukprot:3664017-Rhodomonas_salina.1